MKKQTRQEQSRQKKQYWQEQIQGWKQSGISQAGYCRSQNLNLKTFSYWRRKLRQGEMPVKLVQVQADEVFTGRISESRPAALKLIVDDRFAIEVSDGFNPDTLGRVVETLRRQ